MRLIFLTRWQEGGFESLALTVDFSWYGNRERDIRNNFTVPPAYTLNQVSI
jgi:L-lactate dehydrogenase (cytochrome)